MSNACLCIYLQTLLSCLTKLSKDTVRIQRGEGQEGVDAEQKVISGEKTHPFDTTC